MLKRLIGILFTLAALVTFVWVAMGQYTSWCFAGEEVAVEEVLPVPVDTVLADTVSTGVTPADTLSADTAAPAVPAAPAAPADSLSSPAADTVR